MYCPNCGKEQVAGAKFCGSCGAAIVQQPGFKPVTVYTNVVEYAGFWRRFGAAFLDGIILNIISFAIGFILGFILVGIEADESTIDLVTYTIGIIIALTYYPLMESSSKQATLGKMALGIIVTDTQGKRISLVRAIVRYLAKLLSGLILFIGYIMIAFTDKKQGLHDMIAGTLVILK